MLADIGEGIAECEVMEWFVKPGEPIKQFDKVCLVQSDKATVEITSRFDGVVDSLCYDVGVMAQVGTPLLFIKSDAPAAGGDAPAAAAAAAAAAADAPAASSSSLSTSASQPPPSPPSPSSSSLNASNAKVLASPAVRRIARENNIDLATVPATGGRGHVTKADIVTFIDAGGVAAPAAAAAAAAPLPPLSVPAPAAADRTEKITGIARIMVQTMNRANAIPQFGYGDEFIMNRLADVRAAVKPAAAAQGVDKLSFMPFIVKAASVALTQYPVMNAYVDDDACTSMTFKASHNIGVAMDTPRGLLVPVIRDVQQRSILEIAAELQRLQQLGAAGMLGAEELAGGTFSISNIGSIGGTYCSPIIVPPQVAIAALGKFLQAPRYDANGDLYRASCMSMSLSADHRVIDGATAARFSNAWKLAIEQPESMLLSMK
jgi:2-oxoisovalerate dehydrogenase E2 component (dihydrolipoyl transacylase)